MLMSNFGRNAKGNFQQDSSFYTLFHGARAVLLEDELNEFQWNQIERLAEMNRGKYTNGLINGFNIVETNEDDIFYIESDSPFSFLVDGYDLKAGHNIVANQPSSITSEDNRMIFKLPHEDFGHDLVFLEIWFEAMDFSEKIRKYGGETTPAINNSMYDIRINAETSRRIQLRWRIRSVRNETSLSNVFIQDYSGNDSTLKYEAFDEMYLGDLGVLKTGDKDIKSFGMVYALPLFKVNRNGFKITLDQIERLISPAEVKAGIVFESLRQDLRRILRKIINGTATLNDLETPVLNNSLNTETKYILEKIINQTATLEDLELL